MPNPDTQQPGVEPTQAVDLAAANISDQLVAWIGDDCLLVDQMIIIVRNVDISPTDVAAGQIVTLKQGNQSMDLTSLDVATIVGGGTASLYFVATRPPPART